MLASQSFHKPTFTYVIGITSPHHLGPENTQREATVALYVAENFLPTELARSLRRVTVGSPIQPSNVFSATIAEWFHSKNKQSHNIIIKNEKVKLTSNGTIRSLERCNKTIYAFNMLWLQLFTAQINHGP